MLQILKYSGPNFDYENARFVVTDQSKFRDILKTIFKNKNLNKVFLKKGDRGILVEYDYASKIFQIHTINKIISVETTKETLSIVHRIFNEL